MNARVLRMLALVLLLLSNNALAQSRQIRLPAMPLAPTAESCSAFSNQWRELNKMINDQHESCLQSRACKDSGSSSGHRGKCTCGACEALHQQRDRLSTLASEQGSECRRIASAREAEERRLREAMRQQQEAQQQALRRYNDALSASNDAARRQASIDQVNRLREAYDTARPVARNTQRLLDIFRSDRITAVSKANEIHADLASRLGNWVAGLMVQKRNNYESPSFNTLFSTAKEFTVDALPNRPPIVAAIQNAALSQLRSQFNQVLGDLDMVGEQMRNFGTESAGGGAPSPFRYTPPPARSPSVPAEERAEGASRADLALSPVVEEAGVDADPPPPAGGDPPVWRDSAGDAADPRWIVHEIQDAALTEESGAAARAACGALATAIASGAPGDMACLQSTRYVCTGRSWVSSGSCPASAPSGGAR